MMLFVNPLSEYGVGGRSFPGAGAELTDTRYADDVAAAEDLLWGVAVGTWLLTYGRIQRSRTGEL